MEIIESIFLFFQICGILQLSMYKFKGSTIILHLSTTLSLLIIIGLTIDAIYRPNDLFYLSDPVSGLTDIFQTACPLFGHFVILIQAYFARHSLEKLWIKLLEADQILQEFSIDTKDLNHDTSSRFLIFFFVAQFISTASEIRIIWGIQINRVWLTHWCFTLFSIFITRCEYLLYLLFVDVLRDRLKCLQCLLSVTSRVVYDELPDKRINKNDIISLRKLKKLYGLLWQISFKMNDCFGWSQLANVGVNFLLLTCNFYWIYGTLYYQTNVFATESILCAVSPVTISLVFYYGCENCLNISKTIGRNLHKIHRKSQKNTQNRAFTNTIQQFSLQIINQSIEFNARGFFKMNYDLLRGVSESLANFENDNFETIIYI